jgi:hypothetical protein
MKTKDETDSSVNYDNAKKTLSSQTDNSSLENVLILQGGGSLGAFGCGAFKLFVVTISSLILWQGLPLAE